MKRPATQINQDEPLLHGQGAFVIQFRSLANVEQGRFTGRAEHVASGEVGHFQTPKGLMAFVTHVLNRRIKELATERARPASNSLGGRRREAPPFLFPGDCWRKWKQQSQF
jgi:hypothetical protein